MASTWTICAVAQSRAVQSPQLSALSQCGMNTHVNGVQPRNSLARIDATTPPCTRTLPLRLLPYSTTPPFALTSLPFFLLRAPILIIGRRRWALLPLHHGECFAMLPAIAPGTYIAPSPHTPSSFGQPVTFSFTSPVRFVISHFGYRCRLGCQARHWIMRL